MELSQTVFAGQSVVVVRVYRTNLEAYIFGITTTTGFIGFEDALQFRNGLEERLLCLALNLERDPTVQCPIMRFHRLHADRNVLEFIIGNVGGVAWESRGL